MSRLRRHRRMKRSSRQQATLEFMTTYGWALLVLAVFIGIVVYISTSSKAPISYLPSECYITPALPCQQSELTYNSVSGTLGFVILLQNNLGTEIGFPQGAFTVTTVDVGTVGTQSITGSCTPTIATEGSQVICIATMPMSFKPTIGTQSSVSFDLSYNAPCDSLSQCTGSAYKTTGTSLQALSAANIKLYQVQFVTDPAEGYIVMNGHEYVGGTNSLFLTGGYDLQVVPPKGYTFASWGISASASSLSTVVNANSILSLNSNATITASFITAPNTTSTTITTTTTPGELLAGQITPIAPSVDQNQGVKLYSGAFGGTPPYSYDWYMNSCSGNVLSTSQNYVAPTPNVGRYAYVYMVRDSKNGTACSRPDNVTVNPVLVVYPPAPYGTIDPGQSVKLTGIWNGGSPDYRVSWKDGGSPTCAQDTNVIAVHNATGGSDSITVSPTSGTVYYCDSVADSAYFPVTNSPITVNGITVSALFRPGVPSPASASISAGQQQTFTAGASGGAQPYSYKWYNQGGCAGSEVGTGNSLTTGIAGTYSYLVTDNSIAGHESGCSTSNSVLTVIGTTTSTTTSTSTSTGYYNNFDYSISLGYGNLYAGGCTGASCDTSMLGSVTLTSGSSESVSLSVSCPAWADVCSMIPTSGYPTYSYTVVVGVGGGCPGNSGTVTVNGYGGGISHSASAPIYVTGSCLISSTTTSTTSTASTTYVNTYTTTYTTSTSTSTTTTSSLPSCPSFCTGSTACRFDLGGTCAGGYNCGSNTCCCFTTTSTGSTSTISSSSTTTTSTTTSTSTSTSTIPSCNFLTCAWCPVGNSCTSSCKSGLFKYAYCYSGSI